MADDGTDFSYELTNGTSFVTLTNGATSAYLEIADPSHAAAAGIYTLTITRNSDGVKWTKDITVTD
ncbi:hypothetical protein MFMK1_001599 [Metallumcola ferriviriculae]|uniref:Uncharacterized protein n=1 Tax=Metallumcola ferriviriculae TaxID=3039180 RepID=A0AAU0URF7_9FIRM|nr:hypothetical protein MFMK1_001599 [Desulfitibacteraceae bacterium MK1]